MLGRVTPHDSTVGKLLIAEPMLEDPNFDRTVVLMIEHTPEGALGVVLNRPTELEVDAVLGEWASLAATPPVLYMGGPVEQNGVLALARRRPRTIATATTCQTPGWTSVLGEIGTVDLHADPEDVADGIDGDPVLRRLLGLGRWPARGRAGRGRVAGGPRRPR